MRGGTTVRRVRSALREVCGKCCEDARLFHVLEILGMLASYRVLLSKLKIAKASHARRGSGS